jgi:polysaccharide pyruvyl transferase WcaK-like protein
MTKIPKIIHYCWVGGNPKPQSVLYCIESWKRCCPDYEIREWNETNYDFTKNEYMRQAYEAKKWGFVPDYARLDIVYEHGGIYLDTDVEMVRSFDDLLEHDSFFGFEDTGDGEYFVACGLGFGAAKRNPLLKELRDYYDPISFLNQDGTLDLTPAPRHNTPIFAQYGIRMDNKLQEKDGNMFYPAEYFCPKIFKTGKLKQTKNTYSIHHFSASWMDDAIRQDIAHSQSIRNRFGDRLGGYILYAESAWKKYGLFGLPKRALIRLYEIGYLYWPVLSASCSDIFVKRNGNGPVVLFDTAMNTDNAGDHIIMENCLLHLEELVDTQNAAHVSTHRIPDADGDDWGSTKIVCGTNILSCQMSQYGLWKLPRNLKNYRNITLMGVGFDSYNTKSEGYTRLLLRHMLSKDGYHSVRDSFAEKALRSLGVQNVLNTGCPTMWNLTPEHCASIPRQKARNVVCTVTDYIRDAKNDGAMLDILLESYDHVYLWLQGREDPEYIRELGYADRVTLIPGTLADYDAVLAQEDLDYVGTRLHAGIRALRKGRRSLIVSVDNRAECIGADTGLPTIRREDIPFALKDRLEAELETKIDLPWENIRKWKEQFKEQK